MPSKPASFSLIFFSSATLLFWMGVIFFFSSLASQTTTANPPLWYFIERKSAHVFEYALLMLLAFRWVKHFFVRDTFERWMLLAGIFSLAYAATDELHQFFVLNRGAKITDVGIDGLGILLMASLLWVLKQKNAFKK